MSPSVPLVVVVVEGVGGFRAELIGACEIRTKRGADGRQRTMSGVDKRHIKLLAEAAPPSAPRTSEVLVQNRLAVTVRNAEEVSFIYLLIDFCNPALTAEETRCRRTGEQHQQQHVRTMREFKGEGCNIYRFCWEKQRHQVDAFYITVSINISPPPELVSELQ